MPDLYFYWNKRHTVEAEFTALSTLPASGPGRTFPRPRPPHLGYRAAHKRLKNQRQSQETNCGPEESKSKHFAASSPLPSYNFFVNTPTLRAATTKWEQFLPQLLLLPIQQLNCSHSPQPVFVWTEQATAGTPAESGQGSPGSSGAGTATAAPSYCSSALSLHRMVCSHSGPLDLLYHFLVWREMSGNIISLFWGWSILETLIKYLPDYLLPFSPPTLCPQTHYTKICFPFSAIVLPSAVSTGALPFGSSFY